MTIPHITKEQIAQWREKFESRYVRVPSCLIRKVDGDYRDNSVEDEFSGYIRAKTEQADEIATLKAQLAEFKETLDIVSLTSHNNHDFIVELLPLAKFGAMVIRGQFEDDKEQFAMQLITCGLIDAEWQATPHIEATINKLLKD